MVVGNKEMAQFEYKGSKLTTDVDVFSVGQQILLPVDDNNG